jgi:hypothetical protein
LPAVFGLDTRQEQMYDVIGKPTVEDIMSGYNGTIFAYGQVTRAMTASLAPPCSLHAAC